MYFLLAIPRKPFSLKKKKNNKPQTKKPKGVFFYQIFFYQNFFYQFQSALCFEVDAECALLLFYPLQSHALCRQGKQAEVTLEIWVMGLVLGRNSAQHGKSGESVQGTLQSCLKRTPAPASPGSSQAAALERALQAFLDKRAENFLKYPKTSLKCD